MKVADQAIEISYVFDAHDSPTKASFDRTEFLQLSHSDQFKTLAKVLKGLGQRDFSQGQLEEIIKRLDKNKKDIIFSIKNTQKKIRSFERIFSLWEDRMSASNVEIAELKAHLKSHHIGLDLLP